MGEDSDQRGGPRGGGTQDLTDDYDFEGQHDGAPARANMDGTAFHGLERSLERYPGHLNGMRRSC